MRRLITNLNEKNNPFFLLLFCFFQMLFLNEVHAQNVSIQGSVTSSRYPVKYASVTFIDNADTTNKFSTITDATGNYQINFTVTSVEPLNNLPTKFKLEQNYPNPFSSTTDIPYQIKEESDVQVTIYDILGRVVRKINVGQQFVGLHSVFWDGRNNFGQKVASGVYFYKLSSGNESQVKKMIFNQNANGFSLPHSYSLKKNSNSTPTNKVQSTQGNAFTIRVENNSTTLPAVVPQELQNVVIQNDTTINFSVNYLPTTTIDFDSLHQIIRGFGGANIVGWNPGLSYGDMTRSELQTAFGTGDGQLGFTILRLRISPNSTEFGLNIPSAKMVDSLGGIVIASPWSPPASMKTNNNIVGGELKESSYSAYAAHLKSFADYMADNDAPLYAISLQNEPDATVTYESCDWNATQFLNFMKNNAASIGYRIMMPESQNFVHALSDPTLNDSVAAANVSIIAGHIYGGGRNEYPLAEEKGKEVWMTEYLINSPGSGTDMDTSWNAALLTAESISDCMNANMSAYVWWWMVRYYSPISDGTNNSRPRGTVTRKGYAMSQFARFIRPGFYRIENRIYPPAGTSGNTVTVTAYKDPSSSKIVIVAINSGSTQAETVFRISNGAMNTTYTPYTTSGSKNCEQGDTFDVNGDNFTFTLEPSSITTFVSN